MSGLRGWPRRGALALGLAVALGPSLHAMADTRRQDVPFASHWLASWGASPQAATVAIAGSQAGWNGVTLRESVYSTVGGAAVRVRFTNRFGAGPLRIGGATIAIQRAGAVLIAGSSRRLLFGGRRSLILRRGADALSDPVALTVKPLTRLAVSIFLPSATGPVTLHSDSERTTYVAAGEHLLGGAQPFKVGLNAWYFINAVDLLAPQRDVGAVVALGDSITNGERSSENRDVSWPDDLARRMDSLVGQRLSVVNEGLDGNRVLNTSACCGPAAVSRFHADVAGQLGARDVILLEGVNDIAFAGLTSSVTAPHTNVSSQQIIAGDKRIIAAAHAHGLLIFGGTILPVQGIPVWSAADEAKREAVNRWILTGGAFDGVINFSRAVADPADPERLDPAYDSGDHLHPNDAGYEAMASAVNLAMLLRR